jgi:hypothetical protein
LVGFLAIHFLVAVLGGMFIGFLPEALVGRFYYNTGLGPYSPAIACSALLLGYFIAYRVLGGRSASWAWLAGVLWLLVGIWDITRFWSASWSPEKTRWGYMLANLFGPSLKCSGTECLYELFYTTPFAASVMYSIGAYARQCISLKERRKLAERSALD